VKRILVIGPAPEYDLSPLDCLLRAKSWAMDPAQKCALLRKTVETWQAEIKSWLAQAVAGDSAVRLIDPTNAFCNKESCLPYTPDGQLLYRDDDHLNTHGARHLHRVFSGDFAWLAGGADGKN
jgi:hypothetical protein